MKSISVSLVAHFSTVGVAQFCIVGNNYKEWLPQLLSQHELKSSVIAELRTDIYIASNKQLEVQAYARDINGKEYVKNIYEFADLKPYVGDA
jgi:hypothetical protein